MGLSVYQVKGNARVDFCEGLLTGLRFENPTL